MKLNCWKIRLKMRGPLLTTSSAPLGFGIDAPFARNAAGEYYLAGSLVKGRLKESWQELAEAEGGGAWKWERWIGKEPPPQGTEDWESERGLLQFTDFIFQAAGSDELQQDVITYRIEHDKETKSVKRGQNQMIQSPFAAGVEYWFEGRAWGIVSEDEAVVLDGRIFQGLCFTPALGADTTVGFGVIAGVEVGREAQWEEGTGWESADGERWGLALSPEGPLCLAGRRLADNIFESEPEIAGGVIKGSLAMMIQRLSGADGRDVSKLVDTSCQELCEEFSNLRVLHAKAVKKGVRKRPCAVPLSTVKLGAKQETLKDMAFTEAVGPVNGLAPAFRVDWKKSADVEGSCGITAPPHELRVRTQIETDMRRAKDENLFAYRMLAPRAMNGEVIDEYEWLTEIEFCAIDEGKRQRVQAQLAELLKHNGVPGVGKLKTRCVASRVSVVPAMVTVQHKGGHADLWVVTLQTPALLCDVAEIGAGLSDAFEIYKRYWKDASDSRLELSRMYASQNLVGGGYLWRQFTRDKLYRPYVLTQAGSTFVLKGVAGDAEKCVTLWEERGLPVAKTVRQAFGLKGDASDWQRCPYVPENGFGEIAVDQAWHWEKAL